MTDSQKDPGPGPRPTDTISLHDAEVLTTNWRSFIQPLVPPGGNYIRAFYIPIADIDNLADFHNAIAVRAYLCLEVADDPSTAKVVIVPVDEKGNDIIAIPSPPTEQSDQLVQSSIYDFTQPCPQMCDYSSPLYYSDPVEK